MFQVLTESGARGPVGAHRCALSLGLHGLLIAGTVVLTRESSAATPSRPAEAAMLYVWPQPARRVRPTGITRTLAEAPAAPVWRPGIVAPDLSPSKLPATLPTVADLLDVTGPRSGFESARPEPGLAETAPLAGDPVSAETVGDPVAIVHQPVPRYPAALAQAGIAGRVVIEYVVDTAGRAEPGSLRTLTSTHGAFESAAHASVLAGRYRPARLRGKAVRQLVRQTLSFRLGDRP
ncbi:MAG: energy transducer TonB [Gemmatimonadales bacterium]